MANKTLTTSYLSRLTNANHDGVSQQILDRIVSAGINNALLNAAVTVLTAARQQEDEAFKRYSAKDFTSEDLKAEDRLEDNYMSTIHALLKAYTLLPDAEPLKRKAQKAVQLFKDFGFSINDGYEAEARKTINMVQEWTIEGKYDLESLGIATWVSKADAQAKKVVALIATRIDNESAKVKGEVVAARKATDAAIRQAYEVLNALTVLSPSDELSSLVALLLGIEERAKLYYISGSGKSSSGGGSDDGGDGSDDSGDGGSDGGDDDEGGDDDGPGGGGGDDDDDDGPGGGGGD